MMEINETQEKMLAERGVIVMPSDIEHETYETVLALLMLAEEVWKDKPIRLFCAGHGGNASAAMAIADLVRRYDVVGMLAGIAESSHVTIFAACKRRYVYPLAQIGVHRVAYRGLDSLDGLSSRQRFDFLQVLESDVARIMSEACTDSTYDYLWWLERIQKAGSEACDYFGADWMWHVGFAVSVDEYEASDRLRVQVDDGEPTQPIELDAVEEAEVSYPHVTYHCPYCETRISYDDVKFVSPEGDWFCNEDHYGYYEFGTNVSVDGD